MLPAEELAQANSLDQVVRPLAFRLAGPALGGVLIDLRRPRRGVRARRRHLHALRRRAAGDAGATAAAPAERASVLRDLREGFRYVRRHVWLWGTFGCAAIAYLLFLGPTEVLLPFLVKEELGGSGTDLGLVLGAGGVGSIGCALAMGQRGLPRRDITFMYLAWAAATLAVAGYGVANAIWQLMLASLLFNALETAGTIIWATTKQRHVPASLLGRVSSLDWLISIGLLPISFALTGPVTEAIGVRTTLVGAAALGAAVTLAGLLLPGMRAIEGRAPERGERCRARADAFGRRLARCQRERRAINHVLKTTKGDYVRLQTEFMAVLIIGYAQACLRQARSAHRRAEGVRQAPSAPDDGPRVSRTAW